MTACLLSTWPGKITAKPAVSSQMIMLPNGNRSIK